MLRTTVLKKYINIEEIKFSISHEFSLFLPLVIKNLLLIAVFITLFVALKKYISPDYLFLAFLGIGIVLFVKFIIDFFNLYLDTLVAGDYNITLFMWDGFFNASIEIFDRDRIESISYKQDSFRDRIFVKGDLLIKLDDGIEFPFENIYRPKKVIERLTLYKNRFTARKLHETNTNDSFDQDERFSILVDALSEVVKDYSSKKDTY